MLFAIVLGSWNGSEVEMRCIHVSYFRRHDQAIVSNKSFPSCADTAFTVLGQREVGGAGVSAVQRPFSLAMADDENAGSGHVEDDLYR